MTGLSTIDSHWCPVGKAPSVFLHINNIIITAQQTGCDTCWDLLRLIAHRFLWLLDWLT